MTSATLEQDGKRTETGGFIEILPEVTESNSNLWATIVASLSLGALPGAMSCEGQWSRRGAPQNNHEGPQGRPLGW